MYCMMNFLLQWFVLWTMLSHNHYEFHALTLDIEMTFTKMFLLHLCDQSVYRFRRLMNKNEISRYAQEFLEIPPGSLQSLDSCTV